MSVSLPGWIDTLTFVSSAQLSSAQLSSAQHSSAQLSSVCLPACLPATFYASFTAISKSWSLWLWAPFTPTKTAQSLRTVVKCCDHYFGAKLKIA
eukprot:765541-Hanusia_phi.AAC.2